ncbi:MAG: cbb3-type cytochrome c oxidase subunit 3 [Alphaproteobacteria bacterium]
MVEIAEFLRSLWALWLMAIFFGIIAWVYWPRRRHKLESHGRIPFADHDENMR